MPQKTDAELTTQAQIIRDETTELANTKQRVYDNLKDIIDSKLNNEDVEAGSVISVNGAAGVVVLDAGDIPNTPAGTIASTTAQAAINELDNDIQGHISDATAAHAGTAISNVPAGNIAATTVQAAIDELDTEKAATAAIIGVQDLFIPASAMWPRVTAGCSPLAQTEIATSLFNIQSLDFNQTTQQFAQFQITPPRKWNNGTVTFVPYWTASAGSGTVQWGLSLGAYSNDDALTVALGTPQTSDDTLIATNDLHIGPESSAITVAGTPQDADFLAVQISRNTASDTLTADAKLLGISIRFTMDAAKDA